MMKQKLKTVSMLVLMLVSIIAVSGSASALNGGIELVKLDGDELTPGTNTVRDIERDNTFEVRVQVTAFEDLKNVEIEVALSGYDHNDRVTDVTDVFDMKANVSYVKKLSLHFPGKLDQDKYKLRVEVRDRDSQELQQDYELLIDTARHNVVIKDVDVDPADEVQAGRSVRAIVNLKNYGQMDEDDVKVEFSIPELGVSALPDYLDLESEKTTASEELYLRVPACAKPGQYTGQVTVTYDDGDEKEVQAVALKVVESPAGCEAKSSTTSGSSQSSSNNNNQGSTPASVEKTVITVGAQSQEVKRGEGGAIYPVTFSNTGSETKTYVVGVTGADDWANVKVSPLQTVTLGSGESKSVYVYVSAKETATAGDHMFSVDVKDSTGALVKQIPMTSKVSEPQGEQAGSWDKLKRGLEIGLIVLVVLLIVVGLIVAFNRKKDEEDEEAEDEISGQTYY